MIRIESVKGVKEMYTSLQKTDGLVGYESKSDAFKQIIKSEKDLIALYENVLLNGSAGEMYTSAIASIKGNNAQEKLEIAKQFYDEVKKDVELITKKSHMIRTNEIPRNKLYYNGMTVQKMLDKMGEFVSQPDFYNKLSSQNKKLLQEYLKIEEPKLDLADPDYEKKRERYYQQQCQKIANSKLLPFIEKITSDKDYARYYELASRLANKQIDAKNLTNELAEYKTNLSKSEVENFYEVVEFMTGFNVKNAFEPEKIKKELAVEDSKNVNSADKSAELTPQDIKNIFLNSNKFKRPDMLLKPEIVEGQIFPQPSDKKIAAAGLSYEQTISEIKTGLEQIKAGAKYKDINQSVVKYVKFLANNCPTAEFLPNLNLAEASNCRLAKGNEASKVYEPVGEVEKYLVDGDRFTQDNIEKMINKISESKDLKAILFDENGKLKVRMDRLARVMNNEVDQRFLSENELVCKMQLEDFYYNLKDKEKGEYITSKEDYIKGKNSIMSVDDLKILFQCFVENIDKNPQFRMFNVSPKDFEVVNGREGKMLKNFGCTYDEFFEKLHQMYLDAYEQKAIFASDDKYTVFLRYIMGYCKDMTYAPSVGMNKEANAKENVFPPEEDVNTAVVLDMPVNDRTYAKYVLSLPSARNVSPFQSTGKVQEEEKQVSPEEELTQLMANETDLKKKIRNMKARLKKLVKEAEGREMSTEELQTKSYLQEKIRNTENQLSILKAQISKLKAQIVGEKLNATGKDLTEEQIAEITKIVNGNESEKADEKTLKKAIDETQEIIDGNEEEETEEVDEEENAEEVSSKALNEKSEEKVEEIKEEEVDENVEEEKQEEDDEYELDEELELEIKEHLASTNASAQKMGKLMNLVKDLNVEEEEVEEVKEEKAEEDLEEIVDDKVEEDEILEEIKEDDVDTNIDTRVDNKVEDDVELEEIEEDDVELEEIVEEKATKKAPKIVDDKSEQEAEELGLAMVKRYKA